MEEFTRIEHHCTIRELPIDVGFYTYCANWNREPQRDELPIGPVLVQNEYGGRSVWKLSQDGEDVRGQLLALLKQIGEKPEPPTHDFYGDRRAVKHQAAIWQLGEFREQRAVDDLQRIAGLPTDFGPMAQDAMDNILSDPDSSDQSGVGRLLEEGQRRFASEDYEEALEASTRATELDPENPDAWNNRGIALTNLERHEEAIAALTRVTELVPDHPQAWYTLGLALEVLERHEEALEAYTSATEAGPMYTNAWRKRATSLTNLGRLEDAQVAEFMARWLGGGPTDGAN